MLSTGQIAELKKRLLAERERITGELAGLRRPQSEEPLKDSVGELTSYDQHSSDLGNETFEREKDLGLADNLHVILSQIDEALERLEQGKYGICSVCGREIPIERLEAIPYATTCVADAAQYETTTRRRPVEEELLYPPFARTFTDDAENDNVGFDGEDTWQALAKYGNANSPQDVLDAIGYDETYVDADENLGIVEGIEAVVDGTKGEADQDRIIFPEPDRNLVRKPHRMQSRRGRG